MAYKELTFPSTHPRVLFDGDKHSFFHPHVFGSEQVQVCLAFFFRLAFLNPFNLWIVTWKKWVICHARIFKM